MTDFHNIRTGVIGVGSMGQNHVRVMSEISNLVGVSDSDADRSKEIAEKFDVVSFTDYRDLLKKVEAVTVSVPTEDHLGVAKEVIKSGVHLLVEKPLSGNLEDSKKIVDLAKEAEVVLAVGHIERHNPAISYVKQILEEGIYGDVITMSSQRVSMYPLRIRDVGVIFDFGIHDLDIITYLANSKVKSVYATGGHADKKENEDHAQLLLNLENGIKAHCEVSWLTPTKSRILSVTCRKAHISVDFYSQKVEIVSADFGKVDPSNLYASDIGFEKIKPNIIKSEPLKLELLDFLGSIDKGSVPLVSGDDGVNAVRIAEACLYSLRNDCVFVLGEK